MTMQRTKAQMTVENPASRQITVDVPREIPVGPIILTFTPVSAEAPQHEPKIPLAERAYKSLVDMVGSCKGEDTMEAYFARKGAEKEAEDRQYRRRHGEPN